MRADDMGLEAVEIDLDDLGEICRWLSQNLGVCLEEMGVFFSEVCSLPAVAGIKVDLHASIVGKERSGRSQFRPHIANRAFAACG